MTWSTFLAAPFARGNLDPRLTWWNEPPRWGVEPGGDALWLEPAGGTDFWRKTHYGFEVDNGHVLACAAPPNPRWELTAQVRFSPVHQYDQAGLMVRLSPDCWLKTSVEYEPDEPSRLGAVVTNAGYSDWSTQDFGRDRREIWLRVKRVCGDYTVFASADGSDWSQLRVAHLMEDVPGAALRCGLYACSPRGEGFCAEFAQVQIRVDEES